MTTISMLIIVSQRYIQYTQTNLSVDRRRSGRLDFVLDLLGAQDLKVLDVGCGPGVQFVKHAYKNQFTEIDISVQAVEEAKKNGYESVCQDLNNPLPFKDN